jgi:two-component system, chemotaxis family, protein-glutamate methylesterase/glutaminase
VAASPTNLLHTGRKIRVLTVDDSVVVRRFIRIAIEGDPDLELAGTAANGAIVLQRIPQLNPDVITLDIEMPVMGGIETLRRIRAEYPNLPVVMCSTFTERGAAITLDALLSGANDYVAKHFKSAGDNSVDETFRANLLPKLKQFFRAPSRTGQGSSRRRETFSALHSPPARSLAAASFSARSFEKVQPARPRKVLLIGVSTGGPNALGEILPTIPESYPLPMLITQHMPPMFTKLFADRLNSQCKIRIQEAVDGQALEPGLALIAPGDYHLGLERFDGGVRVKLNQDPPENSCRPSVDVMFHAANEVYKGAVIGVILTGMGHDGLRGCEGLKASGAAIFAQDEATSVVWGMPGFIVAQWPRRSSVAPTEHRARNIGRNAAPKSRFAMTKTSGVTPVLNPTRQTEPLSHDNYQFLQRYIFEGSGIVIDTGKDYLFEARLMPLVRRENRRSLNDLCALMKATTGTPIRQEILEAMITNETLFFRDTTPFEALKTAVLPELKTKHALNRRLHQVRKRTALQC